jgi:hypothetical protein
MASLGHEIILLFAAAFADTALQARNDPLIV